MGGREEVTLSSPGSKTPGAIYYFLVRKIKHLSLSKSLCWIYTCKNDCNPSGILPEYIRMDPGSMGLVLWVYVICHRAWGWLKEWLWILRIFNFYKKNSSTAGLRSCLVILPFSMFWSGRDHWLQNLLGSFLKCRSLGPTLDLHWIRVAVVPRNLHFHQPSQGILIHVIFWEALLELWFWKTQWP